ncbi:molybdopterin-dependent oxidoreductase [Coriobacteriia bacterium Es71-Z0120]|uniref:molybdopterin-dependent oxidoreductase n=1 Tax=Parvivirga hydrogeniphila TaxID=2939460 RepID=UPI002260B444|nr:molybdopterin-dependent oxidoreductase [Parvivirga hydrogeniphila]MCL4079383.1 molybdopterin-dependent oxidoreductase [Parvivirga hydrogeniphila]
MTNNWVDLDNSTLFLVLGANPAENHPASIAHVNHARFDTYGRGRNAGLIVVDPRQTRTARLTGVPHDASNPNDQRKHDRYVRIRPGTNIAFMNGVMKAIIDWMYANPTDQKSINFFAWHNTTASNSGSFTRSFIDDTGVSRTLSSAELATAEYSSDGGTTWYAAPLANGWPKYCDSRAKVNAAGDDYKRVILKTASGWTFSNMPEFAANIDDTDCVFQKLRSHLAPYDAATVADICGCTEADIAAVAQAWIENSRFASIDFGAATATPTAAGYRAATIMYAMGATQFTTGSQGIRTYAIAQTLMGNMGRAGGGINALRGIHNVQGSTDMGLLFDLIPGYSGNPGVGQAYPDYSNGLFGNRVVGTGAKDPYDPSQLGLQQRGFYNMTREWFGNRDVTGTDFDALYACWPKGNGYQHIEAFRRMITGEVKAAVVWGQNPAVTEPNQSAVRQGLENLDLLVVVDMFATETAQCKRKATGVTYLLPACSHVEEAGSVTSSGRWIQWRDRARAPKGNSKSDLELLLRFAKALNAAGAFDHIKAVWATLTAVLSLYNGGAGADPWTVLYAKYGWDGTTDFESLSAPDAEGVLMYGSEVVAENIFKEMASPLDAASGPAGTLWIYSGNGSASGYNTNTDDVQPSVGAGWGKANRAKSRNGDLAGTSLQYPRYGWAWLLNRRIFYNNGELSGDVADVFVAPGYLARLFVNNTNLLADWSGLYRKYSTLADTPDTGIGDPHILPGRFPAYTEPYESPRPDLVARWGKNTANGSSLLSTVGVTTPVGTVDQYPLVLTTIRCVEHFQGGPITRNNPWNVEMEPEPWIELNSVDALKYGIKDGDYVNVITARSNSTGDEEGRTTVSGWAKGFKARVGVGTLANQRVAPGVVAIPWHWGDRGLGTGSRANDLCIDSWDANTKIPEYKVCLCRIEKA